MYSLPCSLVSKRLLCAIPIPAGDLTHSGNHVHSTDKGGFHFCEKRRVQLFPFYIAFFRPLHRCDHCGYFCTLPLSSFTALPVLFLFLYSHNNSKDHPQNEHETSHGSMSRTTWAIEGSEGTAAEVDGRKYGSHDNGAPMLVSSIVHTLVPELTRIHKCSMFCRSMGRHVHIDLCRSENAQACSGPDIQHISSALVSDTQEPKDFISHSLYWGRAGMVPFTDNGAAY